MLSCTEISLTASVDRSVGVSRGAAALPRASRARTLLTAVTLEDRGWGNGASPAARGAASSQRNVAGNLSFHVGPRGQKRKASGACGRCQIGLYGARVRRDSHKTYYGTSAWMPHNMRIKRCALWNWRCRSQSSAGPPQCSLIGQGHRHAVEAGLDVRRQFLAQDVVVEVGVEIG